MRHMTNKQIQVFILAVVITGDSLSVKCGGQRQNRRSLNSSKGSVYWLQTERRRSSKLFTSESVYKGTPVSIKHRIHEFHISETFLTFSLNQIYLKMLAALQPHIIGQRK